MKYLTLSAIFAAALFSAILFGNQASAQAPAAVAPRTVAPAPRAGGGIAMIDVNYIFEKHPRMQRLKEELNADVQKAEEQMTKERDNIRKLVEDIEKFKGTPDYKKIEEEAARRNNDYKLQIALQRKEFMTRESKIFYNVYQEIQQETDYYAKQNGIDLVIQFSGTPVDVENPDSIGRFISRPIVAYSPERDITPIILDNLKRRFYGGRGEPANGGAATRTNGVAPTGVPFRNPK